MGEVSGRRAEVRFGTHCTLSLFMDRFEVSEFFVEDVVAFVEGHCATRRAKGGSIASMSGDKVM